MNKTFDIDIIIPTHNRADLITKTLDSIHRQTSKPKNVIIVDDSSNDNTSIFVTKYSAKWLKTGIKIIYIRNPIRLGVSASRNIGLNRSVSEYILFLDSDDILDRNYIAEFKKSYTHMKAGDTRIPYCKYALIDLADRQIDDPMSLRHANFIDGDIFNGLSMSNSFLRNIAQIVFRRDVVINLDFDVNMSIAEDWDYLLKIARQYKFTMIDAVLLNIREHPGNTIANKTQVYTDTIKFYKTWIDRGISKDTAGVWGINVALHIIVRLPHVDFYRIASKQICTKVHRSALFPRFRGCILINVLYIFIKRTVSIINEGTVVEHLKERARFRAKQNYKAHESASD